MLFDVLLPTRHVGGRFTMDCRFQGLLKPDSAMARCLVVNVAGSSPSSAPWETDQLMHSLAFKCVEQYAVYFEITKFFFLSTCLVRHRDRFCSPRAPWRWAACDQPGQCIWPSLTSASTRLSSHRTLVAPQALSRRSYCLILTPLRVCWTLRGTSQHPWCKRSALDGVQQKRSRCQYQCCTPDDVGRSRISVWGWRNLCWCQILADRDDETRKRKCLM